jgi:hypothetical protein
VWMGKDIREGANNDKEDEAWGMILKMKVVG